jgi:ketosteroid isomerase-like protein
VGEADTQLLRRGYQALARGDIGEILTLLDPDVEIRIADGLFDEVVEFRGHRGYRALIQRTIETCTSFRVELEDVIEAGDMMLAIVAMEAERKDGRRLEGRFAHLYTLRDERAVRFEALADLDEARRLAGLG